MREALGETRPTDRLWAVLESESSQIGVEFFLESESSQIGVEFCQTVFLHLLRSSYGSIFQFVNMSITLIYGY